MNATKAKKIEEYYAPSLDVTKVMINGCFEQRLGEIIDYVDLLNAFNLPLPLFVEACEQIEKEGQIAGLDREVTW